MGVDYYGIIYEDKWRVVAVHLGEYVNPDEIRDAEPLKQLLFEEGYELMNLLLNEDMNICSYKSIQSLTRIAKLMEPVLLSSKPQVAVYGLFCSVFGCKPRIVNEFELFPENKKTGKIICILGEGCRKW